MKDKEIVLGIVLASTLVFGSIKIYNNEKIDIEALNAFKKEVSSSLDSVEKEIIKVIPDTPINKCECNGTKEIVHGDGHKTPCPCPSDQCTCVKTQAPEIEAKVEIGPEVKPEIKPSVETKPQVKKENQPIIVPNKSLTVYTSPNCVWCEVWKSQEMPNFLADGWKITEITTYDAAVPRTEFRIDGKLILQMPYSRLSEVKKLLNE